MMERLARLWGIHLTELNFAMGGWLKGTRGSVAFRA
ncbi:hypothetical protein FHR94_000454 [Halomonas cerina]|uniref:Uncharacterized protein n=1 Tax=Halomonas cerina TaxID=447424 RepID=A0A839V1K7_9GAMM|nr:hypothetical protein [Halomonas cerina]